MYKISNENDKKQLSKLMIYLN